MFQAWRSGEVRIWSWVLRLGCVVAESKSRRVQGLVISSGAGRLTRSALRRSITTPFEWRKSGWTSLRTYTTTGKYFSLSIVLNTNWIFQNVKCDKTAIKTWVSILGSDHLERRPNPEGWIYQKPEGLINVIRFSSFSYCRISEIALHLKKHQNLQSIVPVQIYAIPSIFYLI